MQLSKTFAVALAAVTVSASPIEKREVGGILICTGANSTGDCMYQVAELDKCIQLEKPFYKNVTTFAPDGEDFSCYPYLYDCGQICTSPTGCTFGAVDYNYPHKENFADIKWETYTQSFRCQLNQTSSR